MAPCPAAVSSMRGIWCFRHRNTPRAFTDITCRKGTQQANVPTGRRGTIARGQISLQRSSACSAVCCCPALNSGVAGQPKPKGFCAVRARATIGITTGLLAVLVQLYCAVVYAWSNTDAAVPCSCSYLIEHINWVVSGRRKCAHNPCIVKAVIQPAMAAAAAVAKRHNRQGQQQQ